MSGGDNLCTVFMAYDNHQRLRSAIERFNETMGLETWGRKHLVIVDAGYPLPSAEENAREFELLAQEHGGIYLKVENKGQSGNFVQLQQALKPILVGFLPQDVVLFYDTDNDIRYVGPQGANDYEARFGIEHPGKGMWLQWARIFLTQREADFVTLGCWHTIFGKSTNIYFMQDEASEKSSPFGKYRVATWPGGWPIGIFSYGFYMAMNLPVTHQYYGGTEGNIFNALQSAGKKGIAMQNFVDVRDFAGVDQEYLVWKHLVIVKPGEQRSFDEHLKGKK